MSKNIQETKLFPKPPAKAEIAQQVVDEIVQLVPTDIDIDLMHAVKIP